MRKMRVLDVFSGLCGFSAPFRDRGHEVVTVDKDSRFNPDVVADVRRLRFPGLPPLDRPFDVVLASPPCNCFSVMSIPFHYRGDDRGHAPDRHVSEALGIVACTFRLIATIRPSYWVVENPVGMLRTFIGKPTETVFWCTFDDPGEARNWHKPTDLWGRWPGTISRPCTTDHQTGRGNRNPIKTPQGDKPDPAHTAKIPYGLGEELCRRMEEAFAASKDRDQCGGADIPDPDSIASLFATIRRRIL